MFTYRALAIRTIFPSGYSVHCTIFPPGYSVHCVKMQTIPSICVHVLSPS